MRLGCPNCDALYEVDDAAIPLTGRDVQCSNCGHAWFQPHPETEAEAEAEAAVYGTLPARPVATPPVATPPAPAADGDDDDDDAAAPPAGTPPRRALDETLLAVLREEAAREAEARRADAARMMQTQPDLGLPAAGPAAPRPADPGSADPGPAAVTAPDRAQRRDLLPDIEEINSTLRPGAEARDGSAEAEPADAPRQGFRTGFVSTVAVFVLLALVYLLAPRLAAAVPALDGALTAYVAAVDGFRLWLDGLMGRAAGAVRGISGEGG
jgi:predicted Zn finger-like uncharacterized protein